MNAPSPTPDSNPHPQRSFLRFAVACGVGFFSLLIIAGSRGRLAEVVVDFDVPFSPLTAFALSVVLPAALVLLVIATVSVEFIAKRAATRNAWNAIAIGLAITCLATYIVGVSLPLLQLMEGLS